MEAIAPLHNFSGFFNWFCPYVLLLVTTAMSVGRQAHQKQFLNWTPWGWLWPSLVQCFQIRKFFNKFTDGWRQLTDELKKEFILKKSVKYHFIVKLNYYYTQIMMFKICLPLSMVCKNYNFSVELHTQSLSERKKYIKIT